MVSHLIWHLPRSSYVQPFGMTLLLCITLLSGCADADSGATAQPKQAEAACEYTREQVQVHIDTIFPAQQDETRFNYLWPGEEVVYLVTGISHSPELMRLHDDALARITKLTGYRLVKYDDNNPEHEKHGPQIILIFAKDLDVILKKPLTKAALALVGETASNVENFMERSTSKNERDSYFTARLRNTHKTRFIFISGAKEIDREIAYSGFLWTWYLSMTTGFRSDQIIPSFSNSSFDSKERLAYSITDKVILRSLREIPVDTLSSLPASRHFLTDRVFSALCDH